LVIGSLRNRDESHREAEGRVEAGTGFILAHLFGVQKKGPKPTSPDQKHQKKKIV